MSPAFRDATCKVCRLKVCISPPQFYLCGLPGLVLGIAFIFFVRSSPAVIAGNFGIFAGAGAVLVAATLAVITFLRLWLVPLVRK